MGGFILVTLLCSLCKKISLLLQEGISEAPEGKMGHGGLRGERAAMKVMGVSVAGAEPGCEEGLAAFPGQGEMGWDGGSLGWGQPSLITEIEGVKNTKREEEMFREEMYNY